MTTSEILAMVERRLRREVRHMADSAAGSRTKGATLARALWRGRAHASATPELAKATRPLMAVYWCAQEERSAL